jgi:hypothetical protein
MPNEKYYSPEDMVQDIIVAIEGKDYMYGVMSESERDRVVEVVSDAYTKMQEWIVAEYMGMLMEAQREFIIQALAEAEVRGYALGIVEGRKMGPI